MPPPDEIVAGLRTISSRWFVYGVLWHVMAAAALIAASQRWRPSPQLSGLMLIAPLVSVSVFAWAVGNPFNGGVFLALAAVLALISWRAVPMALQRKPWATRLAALLIVFAWVYPHFLEGWPSITYLIASPLGLVPCPSLALVMGLTLLGYGPAGRAWSLVLAAAGLFFGVFGALRLGVRGDLILVLGAIGLTVRALEPQARPAARRLHLVT